MTRKLDQVNRQLRKAENRIAWALLRGLWQALQDYRQTGALPTNDLQRSFIEVVEATGKVTDASVGRASDEHQTATEVYRQALDRYEAVLKAYGVSHGSRGSGR